jgi:hypothetical protein
MRPMTFCSSLSTLAGGLALASSLAFATTAAAAQPAAPAPAPAPVVTAPAPAPVVVTPAPAPAPAPVVVPSSGHTTVIVNTPPAPAPAPTPWVIAPIEPRSAPVTCPVPPPAPAPAPVVVPTQIRVDWTPQPMKPPSKEELARLRLVGETSRAHGLAVAGWTTLGAGYVMSALVGTIAMDTADGSRRRTLYGGWMTIPVGGPFIAAFYARSNTGGLFTAALGVTQVAGLAMGMVGSVRHRRLKRQLTLAAAPMPNGGGAVAVSGRF